MRVWCIGFAMAACRGDPAPAPAPPQRPLRNVREVSSARFAGVAFQPAALDDIFLLRCDYHVQPDTISCGTNGHPPPAIAEADEKLVHAELARRDADSVFEAATANLGPGEQLVTIEAWLEFGKDGKLAKVFHGAGTVHDKSGMIFMLRDADRP